MNKKINFIPFAVSIILLCSFIVGAVIVLISLQMGDAVKVSSFEKQEGEEIKDEFADWKTYRDEKCYFEIKYPADWYIKKSSTCYFLIENKEERVEIAGEGLSNDGSYFTVHIHKETSNFPSIKEKIESYDIPEWNKQKRLEKIITMKFGDMELIVWDMESGVEFLRGGIGGTIHGGSESVKQREKDLDIFKKMLSSFRFTKGEESFGLIIEEIEKYYEDIYNEYKKVDEGIDISGWDSYIENGYELNYPKDVYSFYDLEKLKINVYECDYSNFPEECPSKLDYSTNKARIEFAFAFGKKMIDINGINYCFLDGSSIKFYKTVKNEECVEVFIISECGAYISGSVITDSKKFRGCMEYVEKIDREMISTLKTIR